MTVPTRTVRIDLRHLAPGIDVPAEASGTVRPTSIVRVQDGADDYLRSVKPLPLEFVDGVATLILPTTDETWAYRFVIRLGQGGAIDRTVYLPDESGDVDFGQLEPVAGSTLPSPEAPAAWTAALTAEIANRQTAVEELDGQIEAAVEQAAAAQAAADEAASGVADIETLTTSGWLSEAGVSATASAVSAARRRMAERVFDITDYGAEQGVFLTGAAMTAGSAVLTTPGHAFTSGDVGKVIGVRGAGPISTDYAVLANDGVLVTTIASVNAGVATLAAPAVTTTTTARVVYGDPIDQPMRDAYAAAEDAGGGNVFIPAGTWVAATQVKFTSGVSVTGAGKVKSRIFYVHSDDGSSYNTTPFLSYASTGVDPETGLQNDVSMSDFCLDGQFFVGTAGYSFRAKLLIVDHTLDSYVRNMAILNCPATGIGYDVSRRCVIEDNTVVNAGRFAHVKGVLSGSSGSAIGVFVKGDSPDATMVFRNNFLIGGWTSQNGTGRSGIHIEGEYGSSSEATCGSHLIDGNYIESYFVGIRDSGALATRIIGNDVRKCQRGILAGSKGSVGSRVPTATMIAFNAVREGVKFDPLDGTTAVSTGIEVNTYSTNVNPTIFGRILALGNQISDIPGDGIYLNGQTSAGELTGIRVVENVVRNCGGYGIRTGGTLNQCAIERNYVERNGGYGIRIAGTMRQLTVENNRIYGNNLAAGGAFGISVHSAVVWTGGRLVGNELADIAAVPTQTNTVSIESGAVLTGVTRYGNTGDASPMHVYKQTGADTTITNTTVFAAVNGASIPVEAGKTYVLEVLINYTVTAAAGAKFNFSFPTGTAAAWSIAGQSATSTVISQTGSGTVAGIDSATSIAARIVGRFTVGSTGGTVTLQAAQQTPTADTLTVKSGTFIEARPAA